MAMVVITCPIKGKEVDTGYEFDQPVWEIVKLIDNSFQCSACGQMHKWSKEDAKLKK